MRACLLSRASFLGLLLAVALFAGYSPSAEIPAVILANEGKALFPILLSEHASAATRESARILADYLQRISGAKFELQTGDGKRGIAVGRAEDFPALGLKVPWDGKDITRREDYLLRSRAEGLLLIGASDLAVSHAVWDLLYRLGYRQFFPGKNWEVIPKSASLRIAVDTHQHPAYHARRIWYGFGAAPWAKEAYAAWCERNRATSGIVLNTGHAYDGILARNKAEFARHPEYLGLVDGVRKSTKFCISNPGLRQLVVKDALDQLARDPELDSVSVDPSDGLGWCECDQCKAMGSISDRALTLANEVASGVAGKYANCFVGMYAYSGHSPPPSIKGHPRVVISVATGFIRGGFSVDQLLDGWSRKVSTLGIREYLSVNTWDRDLPGAARGGDLHYLARTIPHFHDKGARFYSAESSDNWGPNGLGYYLAARMLWDVREAKRTGELVADFLDRAFGSAKEPMRQFYRLLDSGKRSQLSDDLLGRMYRLLADARSKTTDPAILARLDDLVLYTRYVELYLDYSSAEGKNRQQAFEQLIRYAYRIRQSMMIHTLGLYRDLPARDKSVRVPDEARYQVAESKNPWKQSQPITRADVETFLREGIVNRRLLDFEPISFSDRLVPAAPLKLPEVPDGNLGLYSRGLRRYYTWVEKAPATLTFSASGGRIYTDRGPAQIDLYPAADEEGKSLANAEVPADKQDHAIELKTPFSGLHRIEVHDGTAGTVITWPKGKPLTLISSGEAPASLYGRWSLYFYVPKGTKVVGGFASGEGLLLNGSGKEVHRFGSKPGYFRVEVAPGEDGKLWKFQNSQGQRLLMTVPPCLARSAGELLLPAEVVEKDRVSSK
jgi:hypothetical protein